VRVVFAGTPETALPALDALVASRHEVAAVLTRPDAPAGRGRRLQPSPVAARAAELGIEVLTPAKPSDPEFMARLREIGPACCPIVAYGALLRRETLDIPEYGWVNLHFSVLPAWRGAAPVQRSIMAGDEITGATVFSLVEELDAGPVLGTITERIRDDDTAGTLLGRLAGLGAGLLVDALNHIEDGDIGAHPQPEDGVSYAAKLTTEDARVDWTRPAFAVDRQVRGCTPAPGAWTVLGDQRLKIGPVSVAAEDTLRPGAIQVGKREVRVGTATTDVLLGEVQPVGTKVMAAADWGRGAAVPPGAVLDSAPPGPGPA
jgi:methionyl-tRNA formyltransferase